MLDWGLQGSMKFWWYCSWSIIPLYLVLTWWSHKRRRSQGRVFGDPALIYASIPSSYWKSKKAYRKSRAGDTGHVLSLIRRSKRFRENAKTVLITLALISILMAAGRPQWGLKQEEVHQLGVDIVLCVDTSESMKAQDIAPSRLDKARSIIASLLNQLSGNRVGLVGFATTTRLHCPLTLDFRGLRSILDHSFSFGPGTDIEAAMSACIRVLDNSDARTRTIILISDGEDHGGDIDKAIQMARGADIRVFSVGVGSLEGGPIPLGEDEDDGYKKSNGELIWTRLEEETMTRLAQETGGAYFRATAVESEVVALTRAVDALEKSDFSQTMTTRKEDQFGLFLLLAGLLLAIELAMESVGTVNWEDADEHLV